MNRFKTSVFVVAALFLISAMALAARGGQSFKAMLAGSEEAPPVTTAATGEATFSTIERGKVLNYMLHVKDIKDVTSAHIHLGGPGKSGPPVVVLFNGPEKKGEFTGMLADGRITAKMLIGPLEGKTLTALIHEIRTGNAYVNVHTKQNPGGEIRGQIK
ncbi:MAG: CHRD domain-containing protein [Nitrospiraceae bacterium]|nr:CHRD domain-containing protein [Nitrospiraceae bacterium]